MINWSGASVKFSLRMSFFLLPSFTTFGRQRRPSFTRNRLLCSWASSGVLYRST